MVNFYAYRIKNGLKKWIDVPTLWQEEVKKKLVEDGYILNEDGTVTEGYNSKIAALEARIKATEGRVTTEVTNRTIANQGLQSQIEEITNRMVFDENGLTFKNIANGTESPYKINIDNDELKFLNGNEAVQTFDAYGNSVIPNLKVLTMLNLFGYVFSKDASGNLNLDYVGGDE